MKKCDFCKWSHLREGNLVCPYSFCILPKPEINAILKEVRDKKKEKKEIRESDAGDIMDSFDYYF